MKHLFRSSLYLLLACAFVFSVVPQEGITSAASSYVFPNPSGEYVIPKGYSGQKPGHGGYELDFQIREAPQGYERPIRCYSYGSPILAAHSGTVSFTGNSSNRYNQQNKDDDLGAFVSIDHGDGTSSIYAHMIDGSHGRYVTQGDFVEAGQVIGLMGDTGTVHGKVENGEKVFCPGENKDWGTHLHFGVYRGVAYQSWNRTSLLPEPLGHPNNVNIKIGPITSYTEAYDKGNLYLLNDDPKYDYDLHQERIFSITPLQAPMGQNVTFQITGEFFTENRSVFQIPFCSSQQVNIIDQEHAEVTCTLQSATGLKEGKFANSSAKESMLTYQVELQSSPSGNPGVDAVNFITPKPGEFFDMTILGKNLPGDVYVDVRSSSSPDEVCDTTGQFSFLSPGKIQVRCQLPLNLGPVDKRADEPFTIRVYRNRDAFNAGEPPLYRSDTEVNYGIAGAGLSPRQASYGFRSRFTITGRNVHRTSVFFIEGCEKKDTKVISQTYDKVVFECIIHTKPGVDTSSVEGKSFQHIFHFKTRSRFNEQGQNVLSDDEDRQNVILSGYITVTGDSEERIDGISPDVAIIGKQTTFTVKGNNLPYSDAQKPLVWLELCPGTGKDGSIQIVPESFTPSTFEFECVPQFNTTPPNGKSTFDISQAGTDGFCDSIHEQAWSEVEKNQALEKCYESNNRNIKMSMWGYFKTFFETLAPRSLHVKKVINGQKIPTSEQTVKFISELYQFIKDEEEFQFQYELEEGPFGPPGPTVIKRVLVGEITRKNRHQTITVLGDFMPKTLDLSSDECSQIAMTYRSSERYEFKCLLKKVSVQEIVVVDQAQAKELSRSYTDVVEVYDIFGSSGIGDELVKLDVTGVNLHPQMKLQSPDCFSITMQGEPSSSEMYYDCKRSAGLFSRDDEIKLKIFSKDDILLFDNTVHLSRSSSFSVNTKVIPLPSMPVVVPTLPKSDANDASPVSGSTTAFEIDLLKLQCELSDDEDLFLGQCDALSPFLRQGKVTAAIDKKEMLVTAEGHFDATLGKAIDGFTQQKLKGLMLNPGSADGLLIVDGKQLQMMASLVLKGLGIDASSVVGFPLSFDLYDYSGEIYLAFPAFDIHRPRQDSKIIFGVGSDIAESQFATFGEIGKKISKKIEDKIKQLNASIQKKKIELGAKLVSSIEDVKLKSLTRTTYISFLKALEIVPEAIAFYDNYDFVIKGKLKSEPFRPKNWGENKAWIAEANLATVDLDLAASEGRLQIKGDVLNSLTIFNNDILKADRGLINLGLTVDMKKDNGRIDLDQVEVRLPGDLARVAADAHFVHIFELADLAVYGKIVSAVEVAGFEIADAGAGFLYDPNLLYKVDDYQSLGLLRLDGKLGVFVINTKGKAVFTLPGDQLVMDLGGELSLDFLNTHNKLADVLGRARFGNGIKGCFNSETGRIVMDIPFFEKPLDIRGGVSIDGEFTRDTSWYNPLPVSTKLLAVSGQLSDGSRLGFEYNQERSILEKFRYFDQKCSDAPGQVFLQDILSSHSMMDIAALPPQPAAIVSEVQVASSEFSPSMLAQSTPEPSSMNSFGTMWDLEGWQGITIEEGSGTELVLLDKDGNIVDPKKLPNGIPGALNLDNTIANGILIINQKDLYESGYHFALQQKTNAKTHVTIKNFLNKTFITDEFVLNEINTSPSSNILNIENTATDHKLLLGGSPITSSKTTTKLATDEDLMVKAEVSSDELKIPEEPANNASVSPFSDIKSPLLREAVDYLSQRGIISGYPDGTFQPDRVINRAEALKIIFAAQGISPDTQNTVAPFPDVDSSEWFAAYVTEAKSRNLIKGYSDGKYRPTNEVNKAEFIKIAMLAQSFYEASTDYSPAMNQYSDLDDNEWYMPYVSFGVKNGFLDSTQKLSPTKGMTRGEAAMIIYRILKN